MDCESSFSEEAAGASLTGCHRALSNAQTNFRSCSAIVVDARNGRIEL
jgi:hypothetical protein